MGSFSEFVCPEFLSKNCSLSQTLTTSFVYLHHFLWENLVKFFLQIRNHIQFLSLKALFVLQQKIGKKIISCFGIFIFQCNRPTKSFKVTRYIKCKWNTSIDSKSMSLKSNEGKMQVGPSHYTEFFFGITILVKGFEQKCSINVSTNIYCPFLELTSLCKGLSILCLWIFYPKKL